LRFLVSGPELWQWQLLARQAAIAAAIDLFELDWLLLELSDLDRLALRLGRYQHQPVVDLKVSFTDLQALWQQRLTDRTPVQYLVGHAHWRRFTLKVSPAVLIPRPETELIIDLAQAAVTQQPQLANGDWVDLGTGSGAIAIGLADLLPEARIHAVDLSRAALAIAETNARAWGFGERIQFYHGRWVEPIGALRGQLSGLVANPPYIPSAEVLQLQPEVQCHEPHLALDGGETGLDDIQHLAQAGCEFLRSGGFWVVEMMAGQGETVCELLRCCECYQSIQVHHDLAGCDRFVSAYRIEN
jgi:release factor glutamine methyltransferase